MVKLLLSEGAEVNIGGGRLGIPIRYASYFGKYEIVALLLDHGADMTLSKKGGYGTALHSASLGGQFEVAELLIERGAHIYIKPTAQYDRTPLEFAMSANPERAKRLELVKLLISHGADPTRKNFEGQSLLEQARDYGSEKRIIDYLEKNFK